MIMLTIYIHLYMYMRVQTYVNTQGGYTMYQYEVYVLLILPFSVYIDLYMS